MRALDPDRLRRTVAAELAAFEKNTPRSAALLQRGRLSMIKGVPMSWMWGLYRHPPIFVERGAGAAFHDVDGRRYLDFNVVDLAMTMGFGAGPIADAVTEAMQRGAHFLLPIEAAIDVCESLAERTGMPFWQFTLSASGANTEVIRIARALTGREKIVVFDGHYHGHLDETLVEESGGSVRAAMQGLPFRAGAQTLVLPFNDLGGVEGVLRGNEIALVLTEPALTNCTLVRADPGYLQGLYSLCHRYGALLCLDEAHTFQFAYGGLAGDWELPSDFIVLGKGLGTGVSFGLYGMSAPVAEQVDARTQLDFGAPGIAAGGTTYGSTIAILAAQAALQKVLTPGNYERVRALGERLATGLQGLFDELELSWTALHLGPRSGYCLFPQAPRTGREAVRSIDMDFIAARRLWMANRGIWDAMASSGPQVSFRHSPADVAAYLQVARSFLEAVVA